MSEQFLTGIVIMVDVVVGCCTIGMIRLCVLMHRDNRAHEARMRELDDR